MLLMYITQALICIGGLLILLRPGKPDRTITNDRKNDVSVSEDFTPI